MTAPFWDHRSDADHKAMAALLAPLVVASRDWNFIDPGAAKAQTYAWRLTMADVPRPVLAEAIEGLITSGVTWMPKPGEVKAACVKLLAAQRRTAFQRAIRGCDHPRQFESFIDPRGVERYRRCACWERAMAAANAIGPALCLPAVAEIAESPV